MEDLEILEVICIVLEGFDVQRHFGPEDQAGVLELVHIVQIALKVPLVPCFEESSVQVGIHRVL